MHIEQEKNNKRNFMEYFRVLTPLLLFVLSIIGGMIKFGIDQNNKKLDEIDSKLFVHLTNDSIHTPKNTVVTTTEFTLYQNMRDKQISDLKDMVSSLKNDFCMTRTVIEKLVNDITAHRSTEKYLENYDNNRKIN